MEKADVQTAISDFQKDQIDKLNQLLKRQKAEIDRLRNLLKQNESGNIFPLCFFFLAVCFRFRSRFISLFAYSIPVFLKTIIKSLKVEDKAFTLHPPFLI